MRAALSLASLVLLVSLGLSLAACSSEEKGRKTLERYEVPFELCREETTKRHMAPREHRCALVSSMGLDQSMKDTGLNEATIRRLREEWLEKTGYKPFYIPAEERAPEHR